VLQDERVLGALRRLSGAMADAIDRLTSVGTGRGSRNFLTFIIDEATRNLPTVVKILEDIWGILRNVARAAAPAFRDLLDYILELSGRARDATSDFEGLSDFFRTGIRYFRTWMELGIAVVDLFFAIGNAGGARAGNDLLKDLTARVRESADWIRSHRKRVQEFFEDARKATNEIGRVLVAIAAAIVDVFSVRNVEAFADFLIDVLIPALTTVIQMMGFLTSIVHELLAQPVVREIAQWAATFVILVKGLTLLRGAVVALVGTLRVGLAVFGKGPLIFLAVVAAIAALDKQFHFLAPTLRFIRRIAGAVFDWLKEAGRDLVDWFKDVWNQGLLKWIRWPFEKAFDLVKAGFKIFRNTTGNFIEWVTENFGEGSTWGTIARIFTAPFEAAWDIIKLLFRTIKGAVSIFLDAIAGRFDSIGQTIKNIWNDIFGTMYNVIAVVLNKIIAGVNLAIKGLNAVNPFDDIGEIKFHMVENWDAAQYQAEGARRENTGRGRDAQAAATGAEFTAKPGGRLALLAEGGYDEVVLTTDPKHRDRQMSLLAKYLEKTGMAFDRGGYVQGAIRPPGGEPNLIDRLFRLGFNATSAYRPGFITNSGNISDHSAGNAWDFGDTANNIRALWKIIFPLRSQIKQLFGPTYVSGARGFDYGRAYNQAGTENQRIHENHIHLALVGAAQRLGSIVGNIVNGNVGGAIAQLPKVFTKSIANLIGRNPMKTGKGGLFRGGVAGVWDLARDTIGRLERRATRMTQGGVGATGSVDIGNRAAAAEVFRYMKARGFTDAQAAGWVGVFQKESGFNTRITNRAGSGATGLAQWLGSRLTGLHAFAESRNASPWSLQTQLDYVWHELRGTESSAYRAVKTARSPEQAAQLIDSLYERSDAILSAPAYARAAFERFARRFQHGGRLGGYGGGDIVNAKLEPGEHVISKEEVKGAGGHEVIEAMRRMWGGGKQGGPDRYQVGGRTLLVGDSLGVGLRDHLEKLFKNIDSIVKGSMNSAWGLDRLEENLKESYKRVIWEMGANDYTAEMFRKGLKKAFKKAGDDREFVIPLLRGNIRDRERKNDFIRDFAERHDNVTVVRPRGEMASDRVHYGPSGYRDFAAAIAKAVKEGGGGKDRGSDAPEIADIKRRRGDDVGEEFSRVVDRYVDRFKKTIKKADDLTKTIRQGLSRLTEEGGIFEQLRARIEQYSSNRATRLIERQFGRTRRRGAFRRDFDEVDQARFNLTTVRGEREGLLSERDAIRDEERAARAAIEEAKRRRKNADTKKERNKAEKALELARAALTDAQNRERENATLIAQNTQAEVEAIEGVQSAIRDAISERFDRRQSKIDWRRRVLAAFGQDIGTATGFAEREVKNLQDERQALTELLDEAQRTGNRELAQSLKDDISELDVQIAEGVRNVFQTRVDEVNRVASRGLRAADVSQRLATIGETNFLGVELALGQRQGALQQQREGLLGLYNDAVARGDVTAMQELGDALDDNAIALAENKQAIEDNTNAARAQQISDVNDRFGFLSSVLSTAGTIFQGIEDITGTSQSGTQLGLLRGQTGALGTQRNGLLGVLGSLLGYNTDEVAGLQKLDGGGLTNFLLSLAQGPVFESIMARLNPGEEDQFKDLISALLGNVQATNENTKAIDELNGQADSQTFNSSYWQAFRFAIFNGSGQFMPNYSPYAPRMHSGGMAGRDGMYNLQAGEIVTPVSQVNQSTGTVIGEQHDHFHITTPKEVVDGRDLARESSWARRYSPQGSTP
jgi:hypothetical protein